MNSIINDDDGVEIGTFEGSRVHCCPQYTSDLEAKMNPEEVHGKGFALEQRKSPLLLTLRVRPRPGTRARGWCPQEH